ncbi:MAG: c-type cytochrome [bacterium]
MKRAVLFVSGALLLAGAGNGWAAGDAAAGKAKFDMLCATCHGPAGKGDGVAGAALNPKPRDFTDQAWQKATNDESIGKTIKLGGAAVGKSPLMVAWGPMLSDADITNLTAYIRELGKAKK